MATTRIHMGQADQGRRMTLEEFREAAEQPGYLYELAGGVLEVTEVPGDRHGQVVDNAHEALSAYRRQHPGLILRVCHGSDLRLGIPELVSDRHPDLGIIFRGAPTDDRGRQQPAVVVEVVSPGKSARERDYVTKRREYLVLGIREYWIIDPDRRSVTALTRQGAGDAAAWAEHVHGDGDVIGSALLPGFALATAELWAGLPPGTGDSEDPE